MTEHDVRTWIPIAVFAATWFLLVTALRGRRRVAAPRPVPSPADLGAPARPVPIVVPAQGVGAPPPSPGSVAPRPVAPAPPSAAARGLVAMLGRREGLRSAVILSEVLAPPVALR